MKLLFHEFTARNNYAKVNRKCNEGAIIMQTLTITATDDIISKLKLLIDNFTQNHIDSEVRLKIDEVENSEDIPRFTAQELGGILSSYGKMTDKDMQQGINQAVIDRAMLQGEL